MKTKKYKHIALLFMVLATSNVQGALAPIPFNPMIGPPVIANPLPAHPHIQELHQQFMPLYMIFLANTATEFSTGFSWKSICIDNFNASLFTPRPLGEAPLDQAESEFFSYI